MKLFFSLITLMLAYAPALSAQNSEILDRRIHTLQVIANNDPLLPPIVNLGGGNHIEISFDEFSHEYHRYIYRIEHCSADWSVSKEIFESDYLNGFNDMPIDNYEKSFNTNVLYTHYSLSIPNEDLSLKLSGNYTVTILNDEGDEPVTVAVARFSVVEPGISIGAEVSSNTDIDFNKGHQQVSFTVNYGTYSVTDPHRELKTVVMQNRRTDNMVFNPRPDIQQRNQIEFTHNRQLIFPAGNEYHKFEILDVQSPSFNVDRMDWYDPYYHATLFASSTGKNYLYDEDQNGAYIIRNTYDDYPETSSEYVFVHFTLKSERLAGGDVYINGAWTNNRFTPEYRMKYNDNTGCYECSILLKQGYYNYNYLFVPYDSNTGYTAKTDGDFYQTENEYIILVYHRGTSARYDRLVGYRRMNFRN